MCHTLLSPVVFFGDNSLYINQLTVSQDSIEKNEGQPRPISANPQRLIILDPVRHSRAIGLLVGLVFLLPCSSAIALSPRTGDFALTGAITDNHATSENDFGSELGLSFSFDFHWSARNSLRGTLGFLDLSAEPGSSHQSISGPYLTANISHNWFGRRIFPYLTVGLGAYALENGAHRDLAPGMNGGGGIEIRFTDTLTLRAETTLHAITGDAPSPIGIGSVGLKFYY